MRVSGSERTEHKVIGGEGTLELRGQGIERIIWVAIEVAKNEDRISIKGKDSEAGVKPFKKLETGR